MASYPEANAAAASADVTAAAAPPPPPPPPSQHQPQHDHEQPYNQQQHEQQHHHEHQQQQQQRHILHQPPPTPPPNDHDHHHHQQHQQQQHQNHNDHTHPDLYHSALVSPVPATAAVAHHGLQVLQAASAAPMSPTSNDLAQQYAQSAALQMGEPQFSSSLANPAITSPTAGPHASQKVTRLRRACDMCSQRKVKCDESGPPCKPCSDLQVECTFRREMKRRGPPNKHAEAARAAKRGQLDNGSPIPHEAAEVLVSVATTDAPLALDAEAIAPWPILQLLVDDFFTYIHPLMPFPHEPSFRQAFARRADRTNREFLALLAGMIGVLVASFPRSARAHLKAQHSAGLFPTAVTMIDHCRSVALEARGPAFMAKQDMSVDDAAASYFLGLAAGYTLQWKPCRRFLAETMSFCRELGTHRPRDLSGLAGSIPDLANALNVAANKPVDHIKDQIGKRIFWVMVASIRSMSQLGASINELPLPPPTTQEPYPEQPAEVDDEYIFSDQILPQPEGTISLITGFNRNIRIYMTMNELIGVEMCYGINFFDWSAQKNIISNGLVSAKQAIEDLPPQLQIVKAEPDQNDPTELDQAGLRYCPPAFPEAQPENDVRRALAEPMRRRQLQSEIQKANIHASQLATRSYFVERYLNLRDAHPENTQGVKNDRDEMVAEERELIVQDLLAVLTSISQRNLEPNGQSMINKIRQVASTLVQAASERKGPVAMKAEEYLHRFIEILVKLERSGAAAVIGVATDTMGPQDEEEELRNWASLRECQLQFISSGGFLSDL
ncbi:hypothetical protein FHL15_011254 [Xylaria flabelliformis]|uniref:Zn(2)-C6 fungal-type domain-containing protein n=1 Tax=Xylaria flabelliformis TaxID=2512241 RepID=A0A553HIS7_9PEZI|nr:hypothetical protein FHL15_011254 [Xylaria flabelliformis]